jgi:hypothetical protein
MARGCEITTRNTSCASRVIGHGSQCHLQSRRPILWQPAHIAAWPCCFVRLGSQVYDIVPTDPRLSPEEVQCAVNAALYAHLVTPASPGGPASTPVTALAQSSSPDLGAGAALTARVPASSDGIMVAAAAAAEGALLPGAGAAPGAPVPAGNGGSGSGFWSHGSCSPDLAVLPASACDAVGAAASEALGGELWCDGGSGAWWDAPGAAAAVAEVVAELPAAKRARQELISEGARPPV